MNKGNNNTFLLNQFFLWIEIYHNFCHLQIEEIKEDPEQAHIDDNVKSEVDEYLDDLFKKTDTDKDGHVTINEFEYVRDEL